MRKFGQICRSQEFNKETRTVKDNQKRKKEEDKQIKKQAN